jgi:hypothetical protein
MKPTAKHFAYLDNLRESGATNMFAAGHWVENAFNLSRKDASAIVGAWMKTFDPNKTPAERVRLVTSHNREGA